MSENIPQVYSQGHQLAKLRTTCDNWQDNYDRLLEAHKRLQKVNQGLEDKLLRLVDRSESEKVKLLQDVGSLKTSLNTASHTIAKLKNENVQYKNDLNLTVQLLQCNSSHYTSTRLDMLPSELYNKIKPRLPVEAPKPPKSEAKIIRVPIQTFPPTAMVYSVNKCSDEEKEEPVDVVSASILAAVLEEREMERNRKHCPTCTCQFDSKKSLTSSFSNGSDIFDINNSNSSCIYFKSTEGLTEGSNNNRVINNHVSISSDVKAIDVGTQTLPSYIGQTGKVTSTCIYCQSFKPLAEMNNPCNETVADHSFTSDKKSFNEIGCKNVYTKRSDIKVNPNNVICPWDWHAENLDSGFPSSPTSLTSVSLSYESETSCFASPQDSPGHLSLPSYNNNNNNNSGHEKGRQDNSSSSFKHNVKHNYSKEELRHLQHPKKGNIFRSNRSSPHFFSSNFDTMVNESIVEKGLKKRKNGNSNVRNDPFTSKISSSFQGLDSFTPIHISPSERLSSSDSDVVIKGSPMFSNHDDKKNNETTQEGENSVRTSKILKEVLSYSDVFFNDAYSSSNSASKNLSVYAFARTNSATETTL